MPATVTPYKNKNSGKKEQVAGMFDSIAGSYDLMNNLLSLRIHVLWRRKAVKLLTEVKPKEILDVATGTGDFAIEAMKLLPEKITGVDISEDMLQIGRKKIKKKNLEGKIELLTGDCEELTFDDNTFDAVTVGFGVRNFENLEKGLQEIYRVLRPGGKAVILEFSKVKIFPVKQFYAFYFKFIVPSLGKLFAKNKGAYSYLQESVSAFPEGKEFLNIMKKCSFRDVKCYPLSYGIASIYTGIK